MVFSIKKISNFVYFEKFFSIFFIVTVFSLLKRTAPKTIIFTIEKQGYSDKGLKGTIVNLTWNSSNEKSNENLSTVPLNCVYLQVDCLDELVDVDLGEEVDDVDMLYPLYKIQAVMDGCIYTDPLGPSHLNHFNI